MRAHDIGTNLGLYILLEQGSAQWFRGVVPRNPVLGGSQKVFQAEAARKRVLRFLLGKPFISTSSVAVVQAR